MSTGGKTSAQEKGVPVSGFLFSRLEEQLMRSRHVTTKYCEEGGSRCSSVPFAVVHGHFMRRYVGACVKLGPYRRLMNR